MLQLNCVVFNQFCTRFVSCCAMVKIPKVHKKYQKVTYGILWYSFTMTAPKSMIFDQRLFLWHTKVAPGLQIYCKRYDDMI